MADPRLRQIGDVAEHHEGDAPRLKYVKVRGQAWECKVAAEYWRVKAHVRRSQRLGMS